MFTSSLLTMGPSPGQAQSEAEIDMKVLDCCHNKYSPHLTLSIYSSMFVEKQLKLISISKYSLLTSVSVLSVSSKVSGKFEMLRRAGGELV